MGKILQHSRPESASVMRAQQPVRTENMPAKAEDPMRAAQQAFGNQALQRMLKSRAVQAKLNVSPPGDAYEQEAERVADQVMSARAMPAAPSSAVQRMPEIHRLPDVQRQAKADSKDDRKKQPDTKAPDAKKPDAKKPEAKKPETKKEEPKAKGAADNKDDKKKDEVKRAADDKMDEKDKKEEDAAALQRAAAGTGAVPEVSTALEQSLDLQRGAGQPLPDSLRSFFEPRFGHDLSSVRLHTDAQAASAARELRAQAFTRGQDVYFGAGRYQPQSDQGRRLMAHELTHTVQQSGGRPAAAPPGPAPSPGVHRSAASPLLQRQGDTPPSAPAPGGGETAPPAMSPATGVLDEPSETVTFENIEVPGFKLAKHRGQLYSSRKPLKQKKAYKRGDTDQRNLWKQELGKDTGTIVTKLSEKYKKATAAKSADTTQSYIFKAPPGGPPRHYLGDLPTIAQEMTVPSWTVTGKPHGYDVDHIVELQLANWDADTWANTLANMELLDSAENRSSGATIKANIDKKVKAFNQSTNNQYGKSEADIKSKYHLQFNSAIAGGGEGGLSDELYWTKEQIKEGKQVVDQLEVVNASSLGGNGKVVIFPGAAGVPKQFTWPGALAGDDAAWLKPYRITARTFKTDAGDVSSEDFGSLTFTLPKDDPQWSSESGEKTIPVKRVPGAQYAGMIDKAAVRGELMSLRKKGLSPITVSDLDILPDSGLGVRGTINPDIPLLQGLSIDFEFSGGDLTLSKEFGIGDFNFPKPFRIDSTTLKISAGTAIGLQAEGEIDFSIDRVGSGMLKAVVGTSTTFGLTGSFNFDSTLFDPAKIEVSYINKEFSAKGELGIKEGTVKGVKKANINVAYANDTIHADGTADVTIPGVKKAGLTVDYSEQAGLTIGGNVDLADDIPGVSGGSIKAELKKDEAGWQVKASGTATTNLAGFNTTLTATYDNGSMTMEATAAYAKGLLSGTITVGATNRDVDDQGHPAGDPGEKMHAYGGGSVTVQLTPWLQGTVGVMIKPKGGLKLQGQIGLPSSVNLFDEKKVEKEIFSIDVPIPIIPGILAQLSGGLTAEAGFGPGQLQALSVGITYDPDAEEDTEISGTAKFVVPAHAGLRLFVRGGIGLGIPAASATGNLELGGELAIAGAAEATADVDYTPRKGVDLKANAHIFAEPAFKFDVSGVVLVEVGVAPLKLTLYEHRWQLAQFQWGSGLRFGINFPIHYQQGQPFDVKLDDVQFEVPPISATDVLSGLIHQIA